MHQEDPAARTRPSSERLSDSMAIRHAKQPRSRQVGLTTLALCTTLSWRSPPPYGKDSWAAAALARPSPQAAAALLVTIAFGICCLLYLMLVPLVISQAIYASASVLPACRACIRIACFWRLLAALACLPHELRVYALRTYYALFVLLALRRTHRSLALTRVCRMSSGRQCYFAAINVTTRELIKWQRNESVPYPWQRCVACPPAQPWLVARAGEGSHSHFHEVLMMSARSPCLAVATRRSGDVSRPTTTGCCTTCAPSLCAREVTCARRTWSWRKCQEWSKSGDARSGPTTRTLL